MIPGRILNATRYLGTPRGWEPDDVGPCAHLAILDMDLNGLPVMASVWEPTPSELERLNAGAKVTLFVVGKAHPPVALEVQAQEGEANG